MKKFFKWGGITLLVIIVLNVIISAFEEPAEPIPENRELNIEGSEVYGENADVLSVVPAKYTMNYKNGKLFLKVLLKLNKTVNKDLTVEGPVLRLKDEMGVSVTGDDYDSTLSLSSSEQNKLLSFLHSEPGKEQYLIFSDSYPNKPRKVMTATCSFTIEDLKLKTEEEVAAEEEASDKAMDRIFGSQEKEEAKPAKKRKKSGSGSTEQALDDMEKLIDLSGDMFQLSKEAIELANELEKE